MTTHTYSDAFTARQSEVSPLDPAVFDAPGHADRSLVVLPTYNERENLEAIVREILKSDLRPHVLVVDDDSPDGTGTLADELGRLPEFQTRLYVTHRTGQRGLGRAYCAGFSWALQHAYEYIFEMDADFSHNPADLIRLQEEVQSGRSDVAIGSRWMSGGGTRNWSLVRTLISRGGSWYARTVLGLPVMDLTSGFKCFSRQVLERLSLQQINANGYAFQVEVNFRCHRAGFRIGEVPIVFADRERGKSKMNGSIVFEAMLLVMQLRLQHPAASALPRPAPATHGTNDLTRSLDQSGIAGSVTTTP